MKATLDIVRKFGLVPDSILGFEPGKLYPAQLNTFYSIAAKHKVASYFNLRPPGGVSDWAKVMTDWRRWLAFTGPVMTRLVVDNTWDDVKPNGNLDVHDEYPDSQPRKGGHAVALIGYTQDRFIVRSSRGTKWGHNGYGYASLAYAQTAFTEAYGISL